MEDICVKIGGCFVTDLNREEALNENRKPKKERNGRATAALVGGIFALLNLCCFSFTTAIIMGVASISMAIMSKKDKKLTLPARIAIFLGSGAIVFGVAEYVYMLNLLEYVKQPENISQFNHMIKEVENVLGRKLI